MTMMVLLLTIFLAFFLGVSDSSESLQDTEVYAEPEDGMLNMFSLVSKFGYPIQTYTIETADGYLLTTYRIPYGKKCKAADKKKKPVLLMHGLLSSSYDYVVLGPQKSLAFLLADECYDVWIGNNRGNSESQKHIKYTTRDKEFWDFSWHEMGQYDLPAIFDYILKVTKQPSLHYVGHSEGTTQFFVFNSLYPHYAQKVRTMHALAPVAFMKNIDSFLIKLVSPLANSLKFFVDIIGIRDIGAICKLLSAAGFSLCRDDNYKITIIKEICLNIPFLIGGFDATQMNRTLLPAIYGHFPAGSSVGQLIHFAQSINSGHFRQYDYGWLKNLEKYQSIAPPDYNLNNVTAPIAIYYSENDWLSSVGDAKTLISKLPNVILQYKVPFRKFNHLDFLWSIDVKLLLNDQVMELIRKYP